MAAELSRPMIDQFLDYSRNFRWAKAHGEELAPYEGKFVAVAGGKVIGEAEEPTSLERKFGKTPGVYIGYVAKIGTKWVL